MITVILVDDNQFFRKTVVEYLDTVTDIQVIGEANNGIEAQAQVLSGHPQVVILDWLMPQLGGLETIKLLQFRAPDVAVIVLTMHADEVHVQNAVKNGAQAYLLKEDTVDHLIPAIRAVVKGNQYFSPRIKPLVNDSKLSTRSDCG